MPVVVVGMSKLKIDEMVEVIVALREVPCAVVGLEEETGTIRWGNWKAPLRLAGQVVDVDSGAVEVKVAADASLVIVFCTVEVTMVDC